MHPEKEFFLFGITPAILSPVELGQVNNLFQEGLDYLYIRSEATDAVAWYQLLEKIDPAYHSRLLLPGNAPETTGGSKYFRHIREKERLLRLVAGAGSQPFFSTSIHDLSAVPQLAGFYQYVFYSPLFPSISKPGYQPQLDLRAVACQVAGLQQEALALPGIIGLGGVNAANIAWVKSAGFQGAALLGALWQSESPVKALVKIKKGLG
jgi:thiamine-phosphate pyrophosphorylase